MAKSKPAAADPLDEWLPLLVARRAEMHYGVAVLEVTEPTQLLELAANPKIRRYLLARLSDTVALVEPGSEDALAKALLAAGHTPKHADGPET